MMHVSGFMDILAKGHYYLDPGSGSFLLQILLAVLLGGGYAVKVYWSKIKALFKKPSAPDQEAAPTEEEKSDGSK
jgi:hypothetical protein